MVELTTLRQNSSTECILEVIERDGACVVENVLDSDTCQRIISEVKPFIDRTTHGESVFSGDKTRRTGALVARAPAVRDIVTHALVISAAKAFLGKFSDRIQLNLTQTIAIEPGQGEQPIHRDRFGWGNFIPKEIEPQFNAIWALSEFTPENGATRVVPGSHQWDWERKALPQEIGYAAMSQGSVLLHTGSVLHSGGKNNTADTRLGLNITYCLGWLRQEENQYLSSPPDIARNLSLDLQELLGYTQGNYALGYYSDPDGRHTREAGILPPETALDTRPRTSWVSTDNGYKSTPGNSG